MIWEPHALFGSRMAPFERQMVPYGSHMCFTGAIFTFWEQHAPFGSDIPYGGHSHVYTMGGRRPHMGAECGQLEPQQWITLYWSHMAIWELCAPYGSRIHHMGGGWHHMGPACNKQEPCGSRVLCGSYLHHIGGGWCHMGATYGSLMHWMRARWRHEPSVHLENQV
jgi:hypothetical protein